MNLNLIIPHLINWNGGGKITNDTREISQTINSPIRRYSDW